MLEKPSVCFQIHLTEGKVVLIQFNKYLLTTSDVPVFKTYVRHNAKYIDGNIIHAHTCLKL